jgi:hypothetical protein
MQPQPGQLIRAPFLSAPAEVKKFEPRSGYYLLEVVLEDGQHTFKPLRITGEKLASKEGPWCRRSAGTPDSTNRLSSTG